MIIEEIRNQIETCGKTRYQISKDTGIDQAALCKIMQGADCKTATADALLKYFGLKLAKTNKKKTGEK
jgi:DNA transposition AAA+ family ATPase